MTWENYFLNIMPPHVKMSVKHDMGELFLQLHIKCGILISTEF
jgi:hypothetical protein